VDEEVNQDKNSEADGMNLEVDSKDEVMRLVFTFTDAMIKLSFRVTVKVSVMG